MTDRLFAWAIAASLGTHLVGLAAASGLGAGHGGDEARTSPVPIEIVRVEPEAPPPPSPPPRDPPRKAPRLDQPATQKREVVENRLMQAPARLLDDPAPRDAQPPGTSTAPSSFLAGNAITSDSLPAPKEGGEAGAGRLFETGDLPIRPGLGTSGGSGAQGRGGTGLASRGGQVEVGGRLGAGSLTSLARPLGGYQHVPAYPESARRQ